MYLHQERSQEKSQEKSAGVGSQEKARKKAQESGARKKAQESDPGPRNNFFHQTLFIFKSLFILFTYLRTMSASNSASNSNSISAEQQQREAVETAWALSMQRAQARIAAGETPPEIRFDLLPQEQAQALMRCTHLLPPSMQSFSQAFPWLAFILQERFPQEGTQEGNI